MKRLKIGRATSWLVVAIPIMLGGAVVFSAQYGQNATSPKIDISSYPPEIRKDYRVFNEKCSTCHSTASSIKLSMSPVEWKYWVTQMENRASSDINDKEAKQVLDFLNYDETHRKAETKAAGAGPSKKAEDSVSLGRQFYLAHNCDLCHTIGGKGGAVGPALDDVGNTQTREELVKRMQGRRAGTVMPPLPPETSDQQIIELVDYLVTLKGKQ